MIWWNVLSDIFIVGKLNWIHSKRRSTVFFIHSVLVFVHMSMFVLKKVNVVLHVLNIPVLESIQCNWSMNFYHRKISIDYINEFKRKIFDKVRRNEKIKKNSAILSLHLAEIDGLECCPYCPYAVIVDNPDDKIFRCLNPECLKETCR